MANASLNPKQQQFLLLRISTTKNVSNESINKPMNKLVLEIEQSFNDYSESDKKELLRLCSSWIETNNSEYLWLEKHGYKIISIIAKNEPLLIRNQFTNEIAQLILDQDGINCNEENVKLKSAIKSLENAKNNRKIVECFARYSCIILRDIGLNPRACDMFLQFKFYPEDQDNDFAKYMTRFLADLKVTKNFSEIKKMVDQIINLIEHWVNSEEHLKSKRKLLLVSELYQIIRQDEPDTSGTVSQLLKVVDMDKIQDGLNFLPYSMVHKAAQNLTRWLIAWPYAASYVAPHAVSCILQMAKLHKEDDIIELATTMMPKLLQKLMFPALQCMSHVFFCLLVNSYNSDEPLKQLLPILGDTVTQMKTQSEKHQGMSNNLHMLAGLLLYLADKSQEHGPIINKAFKDVHCLSEDDLLRLLVYEMPWMSDILNNRTPQGEETTKLIHTGPRGLTNLGNTCYMNSILQCLYFTPRFRRQVLMSNPTMPKEYVLFQFQRLIALMKFSHRSSIALNAELIAVVKPPGFTMGHQEDCSEFLVYVLNTLHEQEESLRAPIKPAPQTCVTKPEPKSPVEEKQSPGLGLKRWTTEEDLSDSDPATLLNGRRKARSLATFDETPAEIPAPTPPAPPLTDAYSDSKDSGIHSVGSADLQEEEVEENVSETLVQKVFGGKQITTYKCLECDYEYRTSDKFLDLQLSIPILDTDNQELNVQDLISYLIKPEELIGENQYHCRNCNKLQDATRTISIEKPPEHLIFTLKRFDYQPSTNQTTKLMIPIECPNYITLPTVNTDQEYEIYAVVLHTGSTPHSGHYHTQAKSEGHWIWLNDETVTEVSDQELGKADTPYVLFYRQCNLDDGSIEEPNIDTLLPRLQQIIADDNRAFQNEKTRFNTPKSKSYYRGGSPPPPPSSSSSGGGGCGDNLGATINRFVF